MNQLDLYRELENQVKADILKNNFIQEDRHLDRQVWSLPGHFIVLKDLELINYLSSQVPLTKYDNDLARMEKSLEDAINLAKKDKDSRQLMVFNDSDYNIIHQCFTHFQFVMTARDEFDLYVYQRSADVSKLKDDLTFFANLASMFGDRVGINVTKIVVVYGSIHFTKE